MRVFRIIYNCRLTDDATVGQIIRSNAYVLASSHSAAVTTVPEQLHCSPTNIPHSLRRNSSICHIVLMLTILRHILRIFLRLCATSTEFQVKLLSLCKPNEKSMFRFYH
jgi:hypothetical protein